MNEQQEKTKFRQAIDHTLTALDGDPFLYQRVVANAEKGEKTMKHWIPKGLVIALIALLCMGAVAVAAGVYGGTVNWLGEVVPNEHSGEVTATMAPPAVTETIDLNEDYLDQLVAEGTMLLISEIGEDGEIVPNMRTRVTRTETDWDAFQALLEGAEYLPLPNFIPEGYEFVEGEVHYQCRADGQWNLLGQQNLGGGLMAEWYAPGPDEEIVSGYYMLFRESEEDYHYLSIHAMLTETQDVNEQTFGFLSGQTAQAVSVPGMNNALAITGPNTCDLSMLRMLEEPIDALRMWDRSDPQKCTYTEVDLSVFAPLLDVDTLISMFAAE